MLNLEENWDFSVTFAPFYAQDFFGAASQRTSSSLPRKPAFRKGSKYQIYFVE